MGSFLSRVRAAFAATPQEPELPRPEQLDDGLAEIVALLAPPTDRRSAAAWDDYWRRQLSTGFAHIFDMMVHDRELVALVREQGKRRVLVAGNGISIEPRALAAAGFEVVAVDLSPMASEIAQKIDLTDDWLASIIGENGTRGGGTISFVAGDLFDPAVARGPFDVIIERRTAQGYPDEEREALLSALAARLSAEGIFVSHCHDGSWRPGRDPRHITGEWFRAHGWNIRRGPDQQISGRSAWLFSSTG